LPLMIKSKIFAAICTIHLSLLPWKEVMEQQLFGDGIPHPKLQELTGDFLAIAISDVGIVQHHGSDRFVSHHAGMTKEEMDIPFIVIEIKDR